MRWTIHLGNRAQKDLRHLPARDRARIAAALETMSVDPMAGDVLKLKGQNAFRRRVGDYRIIFDVDFKDRSIRVFSVLRRTSTTYR